MQPTTPDSISPPANVLLVHTGCHEPDACEQLRTTGTETVELRVSFSSDTTDRPHSAGTPSKLGLISVGDVLRSASADTSGETNFNAPIAVDTVDDPGDLASIGLAVSRFCEHWATGDEQFTVCVRSLDAALRHSSPKAVFRFLHILVDRLSSVDAHAHVHFDPSAFDDRTVATFRTIFDAVVCDESVDGSLPEATDDEVATVLEEWTESEDGTDSSAEDSLFLDVSRPASEATDDEIAQLLEQQ